MFSGTERFIRSTKEKVHRMEFDINGFINTEKPDESICREERQYAALLYAILLRAMHGNSTENEIVEKLLGEKFDRIDRVFFEATLMRDYFENGYTKNKNRRINTENRRKHKSEFNKKLIENCFDEKSSKAIVDKMSAVTDNGEVFNLGSNSKLLAKLRSEYIADETVFRSFSRARYMMNAKPDIMVIFTFQDKVYAKSLECKYISSESNYENGDSQTFIQNEIMRFLFDGKIIKYGAKEIISKGSVILDFKDKICEDSTDSRLKYFVDKVYKYGTAPQV